MFKIFVFVIVISVNSLYGQNIVNRVRVKDHREYMVNVIQEVVKTIEENGWWNLKLPDIQQNVNQNVLNERYEGTVTYKNGFLSGVQGIDVLQSSLQQIWSVVSAEQTTQVQLRGQLRMTDVSLGYDIESKLNDETNHFTGVITQPMVTFDFAVTWNANRNEFTEVTVTGNHQTSTARMMNILPRNRTAGALINMFDRTSTLEGIRTWTEILQPIALDVVHYRVNFPGLCYNCAVV